MKQQERNRWKGQNGPRDSKWAKGQVGLLLCTPERVELTVNSKKETNDRVKMGQRSSWTVVV